MPAGDQIAIAIARNSTSSAAPSSVPNENAPSSINPRSIQKYFFGITEILLPLLFTIVFGSFIKGQWDKEVLQKHKNETFGGAFSLIVINTFKLLLDLIQAQDRKLGILGHFLIGATVAIIFGVAIIGSLAGDAHIAAVATDLFITGASILGVKDAALLAYNIYKYTVVKAQGAETHEVEVGNLQEEPSQDMNPNLAAYWQNIKKYGVGTFGSIFTLLGIITLLKYQVDGAAAAAVGIIAGTSLFSVFLFGAYNLFFNNGDKTVVTTMTASDLERQSLLGSRPQLLLKASSRKDYIEQESNQMQAKQYMIDEIRIAKREAQNSNTEMSVGTTGSNAENKVDAIAVLRFIKSYYKGTNKEIDVGGVRVKSFAELRRHVSADAFPSPRKGEIDFKGIIAMAEAYEDKFGSSPKP